MNQTVMVFADSTARSTALSGVVAQGMVTYLTGTNSLETYNGSAWVSVNNSKTLLSTTSLTGSSTTVSSISSAYQDLEIYISDLKPSTSAIFTVKPNGSSNACSWTFTRASSSTLLYSGNTNADFSLGKGDSIYSTASSPTIYMNIRGYNALSTAIPFSYQGTYISSTGPATYAENGGGTIGGTAITSLVFGLSTGTFSGGTVKIYGVK